MRAPSDHFPPPPGPDLAERAARLVRESVVIDGLGWSFVERPTAILEGKDGIDRALEAGLTASNQYLASHEVDDFKAAIHNFWRYFGLLEACPEKVRIVESADDILRAKQEGKLGLILGFQGAAPLENDLAYLTIFKKLGLRIMGLAYNRRNRLGDGCQEPENRGLTAFGIHTVQIANRLGILVDCTHSGIRTSLEAIETSTRPVVFTHSNARALCDHYRNLTDEQIDAAAACRGVIGISSHSALLKREAGHRPSIEDVLDHIEYVVNRAGIDHVGIGSDMMQVETLSEKIQAATFAAVVAPGFFSNVSGEGRFARGFDSFVGYRGVALGLLRRGYGDQDIQKILGGNWLRVFREVWC